MESLIISVIGGVIFYYVISWGKSIGKTLDILVKHQERQIDILDAMLSGKQRTSLINKEQRKRRLERLHRDGTLAFMDAAQIGDIIRFKKLLKKVPNVNEKDENGFTALMYTEHADITRGLIEAGADVNATSNDGRTALMLAASSGLIDIVKILLDNKANVNLATEDGWTALTYAVDHGYLDMVKTLIEAGANVNASSDLDETPLSIAKYSNHSVIVQLLKKAGAKDDEENNF